MESQHALLINSNKDVRSEPWRSISHKRLRRTHRKNPVFTVLFEGMRFPPQSAREAAARLRFRIQRRYCFSSTNVETLPNRLLSATVVIFFPSGETVILSTLSTLPSRLKVASIERSLNFLSDTVSFAYVPFTGYSLPSSLASQFVPVPVDMLSPSPPPFQVLVSPAASRSEEHTSQL